MSSHFDRKIKKLQHILPTDGIITQQYLDLHGIYRQLSRKYVLNSLSSAKFIGCIESH